MYVCMYIYIYIIYIYYICIYMLVGGAITILKNMKVNVIDKKNV